MSPWALVTVGAGTVGYWVTLALARSRTRRTLAAVVICDRAAIRARNAITCPAYAGRVGQAKADRLAELVRDEVAPPTRVGPLVDEAENIDWPGILGGPRAGAGHRTVVLVGLDRWQSRLIVAEDLRRAAGDSGSQAVLVQAGLDRGQASVGVFGCELADPCPACGLPALPQPEPCVVLGADGRLVRGDLHPEAAAVGRFVRQVVEDLLADPASGRDWISTKSNLVAPPRPGGEYRRFTRTCRVVPGCLGPHAAAPIAWDAAPTAEGAPS